MCNPYVHSTYYKGAFFIPTLRRVMSMGILQGIFKPLDKPQDALGGSRYCFFFGNTSAGKPVNEQTAMQMTAVYSCVSSMVPGNETAKTLIRELKLSKINSSRIVA